MNTDIVYELLIPQNINISKYLLKYKKELKISSDEVIFLSWIMNNGERIVFNIEKINSELYFDSNIIGSWKTGDENSKVVLTFTQDGTASYESDSIKVTGNYEKKENNKINIDIKANSRDILTGEYYCVVVSSANGRKMELKDSDNNVVKTFEYNVSEGVINKDTSETMKYILEQVVAEGGGKKGQVEGYRIGGKTATSQTLPRSDHKYIASFVGFAPAAEPNVLVMVIIRNPSGISYGGTIAAPVAREIFENILPYLE